MTGEAFFESLICEWSIPHHIVTPKDLGIDYFCEWVYEEEPSGVLFAVQVKTISGKKYKPKFIKEENDNSKLEEYKISHSNLKIDEKTLCYWKGLGIPVYLFVIYEDEDGILNCFYRRYTSIITQDIDVSKIEYSSGFCKVNDDFKFLAFKDSEKRIHGFARDLFIDYMRCNYEKGLIAYFNPKKLGLKQFPDGEEYFIFFDDIIPYYKESLCYTFNMSKKYLEKLCES